MEIEERSLGKIQQIERGMRVFSCSVIGSGMLRPKKKSAFEWDLECGVKRKAREKETADDRTSFECSSTRGSQLAATRSVDGKPTVHGEILPRIGDVYTHARAVAGIVSIKRLEIKGSRCCRLRLSRSLFSFWTVLGPWRGRRVAMRCKFAY